MFLGLNPLTGVAVALLVFAVVHTRARKSRQRTIVVNTLDAHPNKEVHREVAHLVAEWIRVETR